MSDVKLERKEPVSRGEAADLLSLLAKAFTKGGDVDLPFGPGTVSLRIPDSVRAEFEVEVEDGEIEIEVEFKWSTAQPAAAAPAASSGTARRAPARQGNGARKSARNPRAQRH